jgi:hypothetical protein
VDSSTAQRRYWLEYLEAACDTLSHEPELITSITVCSGLGDQPAGEVASLLRSARRIARRYGVNLNDEVEGNHVSVLLRRGEMQLDDGFPRTACDVLNGHVAVRAQPALAA